MAIHIVRPSVTVCSFQRCLEACPLSHCKGNVLSVKRECQRLPTISPIARGVSSKGQNATEYCVDMVRRYDYENFLSCLLLSRDVRSIAFAVKAFNVEIAQARMHCLKNQVRDMVHDKKIGEMRMQFWKDALDKIYSGRPPHQPVALELARLLRTKTLSRHWFNRMIDCRKERLSDLPFANLAEVEIYSEHSVSSSYYLILEGINIKNVHADHVASHTGKAQGVTNLIRSIPFNTKNGRIYLPSDIMIKHKLSQEDVFRGRNLQALKDVVHEIACLAHKHVEMTKTLKRELPDDAILVFLSLKATHLYLTALEKADFNVFDPKLQKHNAWLPVSLWWSKMKRS